MIRIAARRRPRLLIAAAIAVVALVVGPAAVGSASADVPLPTLTLTRPADLVTGTNSGLAAVGQTLSIQAGEWSPSATNVTYQWFRDRRPIPNATGSSYVLQDVDQGQYLYFAAEATKAGYQPYEFTSAASITVTGPATLSRVSVLTVPTIQGTPQIGVPLTVTPGTFDPPDADVWYDWQVENDHTIEPAAEGSTFTPTAADVGYEIAFRVYAYAPGYEWGGQQAQLLSEVLPSTLESRGDRIYGDPVEGSTLTAYDAWNTSPDSIGYQWMRDGNVIPDATESTYSPTSEDVGQTLSTVITAYQATLGSLSVTATASGPVARAFASIPRPTITGSAVFGETLTAHVGTTSPSGATFTYNWFVGGVQTEWMSGNTFTLDSTTLGEPVTVQAIAIASGYGPSLSDLSNATAKVAPATTAISSVSIPTTVRLNGQVTPTVKLGAGTPADAPLSYSWKLNGTAIKGAMSSTFVPPQSEFNKKLSVTVSIANADYTASSATSNAQVVEDGYLVNGNPIIGGSAVVGGTLHGGPNDDGWGPQPLTMIYRWYEIDNGFQGRLWSKSATLVPTAAMVGKHIQLWESATEAHFYPFDGWMLSQVVTIKPGSFAMTAPPTVIGKAVEGSKLTATNGTWSPSSGARYHYRWQTMPATGTTAVSISGATASTFTPSSAQVGKRIRVCVEISLAGYTSTSYCSAPSAIVTTK